MVLKTSSLDVMFYCVLWSVQAPHAAKLFETPDVLYINIIISLFGREKEQLRNLI